MKRIMLLSVFYVLIACSKDEPRNPAPAKLIFPLEDSECTTGQNMNQNTRLINFQWEAAANAQRYSLQVINLNTNAAQMVSTNENAVQLPLVKGVPYSWSVVSENTMVTETARSEVWRFFNAGSLTTRAPFPTKILGPLSGVSVVKDMNNEVTLTWQGADVDNDIELYEVYFSDFNPPLIVTGTTSATSQEFKVTVVSNTIYYWSVKTIDQAGNSASSGVYSFRVL
jgi:hypothetical protein